MTERNSVVMPALATIVGLALVALLFTSSSEPAGAAAEDLATLRAEVAQLRAEVAELKAARPARGGERRSREAGGPRAPRPAASMAREADSPGAKAAVVEVLESDDPSVRESIGSLVRDELEQERDQRWERRQQRRAERQQTQIEELAASVDLSVTQQEGLAELLTAEREVIGQAFRDARESGGFEEARELVEQAREETAASARRLLDDEQYEAWTVQREEELARRRR